MVFDRTLSRAPARYQHVYQPSIFIVVKSFAFFLEINGIEDVRNQVYGIWTVIHAYSGIDNGSAPGVPGIKTTSLNISRPKLGLNKGVF